MKSNRVVRYLISFMLVTLLLTACGPKSVEQAKDGENNTGTGNQADDNNGQPKSWSSPPEMKIDANKTYTAVMETSKGSFTIELFAKDAPQTVNNFVFLAKEGFYDGVKFHRIIQDFMIQGGDPLGNGTGGPGYTIVDELPTKYTYEVGEIAMARTSAPNSAGSQFFICTGNSCSNLSAQPDYVIFGKVVSGMESVDKIAATPVEADARGEMSQPTETVTITSIKIEEK
ncbi:MAG TPA: peptidylprolyl isomerase [Bacilli bacterium]